MSLNKQAELEINAVNQVINIVIVEDFKLTRVGLRCALNENPDLNVVAESEDAVEGLKLIEKHKPDVVLMDLGLPGMNGIEAMIKVKEFAPQIKIIALTSHDREEEVVAALSSGASAYCLKDIDPQKLADVVRDVLLECAGLILLLLSLLLMLSQRLKISDFFRINRMAKAVYR